MAPSTSPFLYVHRALDVRHDPSLIHVLAEASPAAATSATSHGVSGAVIGLSVLLAFVGIGAFVAVWYIFVQRDRLLSLGTIRVLYNVDNLKQDTSSVAAGVMVEIDEEKGAPLDADAADKMYTIDLSEERPQLRPAPSTVPVHVLPPAPLRRKHTRNTARQRLRIVIPSGVALPDVELVTTATMHPHPQAQTPNTGRSTAVSATRAVGGVVSRRNTARTPRSALSSTVTAMSSAAMGIVHRREKVDTVYQSNGWAPATIVYLPKNPRDATRSPSVGGAVARKLARKPARHTPSTAAFSELDEGKQQQAV